MFEKLLQFLSITCRHRNISQPFSSVGLLADTVSAADWDAVGPEATHYVVCLDCGHRFAYDWDKMRIVRG